MSEEHNYLLHNVWWGQLYFSKQHLSLKNNFQNELLTFFIDAKWNVVDSLQFDTGAGQHLQLHGSQGGRFQTLREDNNVYNVHCKLHWASFTIMDVKMFLLSTQNKWTMGQQKLRSDSWNIPTGQFCSYHRVYVSELNRSILTGRYVCNQHTATPPILYIRKYICLE